MISFLNLVLWSMQGMGIWSRCSNMEKSQRTQMEVALVVLTGLEKIRFMGTENTCCERFEMFDDYPIKQVTM